MTEGKVKLRALLDEVEDARAEAYRLYRVVLRNPDRRIEQQMWKAMERQIVAMRTVLKHTNTG